jgi:hypothetical protein
VGDLPRGRGSRARRRTSCKGDVSSGGGGVTGPALVLHDVGTEPSGSRLRWKFELRQQHERPRLVLARSTRNGLVTNLQQLGPVTEIGWSAEVVQAISERIIEELARVKLASALGNAHERRAARARPRSRPVLRAVWGRPKTTAPLVCVGLATRPKPALSSRSSAGRGAGDKANH